VQGVKHFEERSELAAINIEELFEGFRNPCKKIAIYLMKRHTSASNPEIGAVFNISYSGVTQAVRRLSIQLEKDKKLRKQIAAMEAKLYTVKG